MVWWPCWPSAGLCVGQRPTLPMQLGGCLWGSSLQHLVLGQCVSCLHVLPKEPVEQSSEGGVDLSDWKKDHLQQT